MEMFPLVTVIIPTYKNKGGLKSAIDSVLHQSYSHIEIIVVDDNAEDSFRHDTELLMQEYETVSHLIYIKHDENRNGAVARNTGILAAKGFFISFLDDDDIFSNTKIEKQVSLLLASTFQGVYCSTSNSRSASSVIDMEEGNLTKKLLMMEIYLPTSTLLFYTSVLKELGGFDESFVRHQDYELLLRFFEGGNELGYVKDVFTEMGNQGQNQVRGLQLFNLKNNFLNKFSGVINGIDSQDLGYKDRLYATHYAAVFVSLLKDLQLVLAVKVFFKYFKMAPLVFLGKVKFLLFRYLNLKFNQ